MDIGSVILGANRFEGLKGCLSNEVLKLIGSTIRTKSHQACGRKCVNLILNRLHDYGWPDLNYDPDLDYRLGKKSPLTKCEMFARLNGISYAANIASEC